MIGEDEMLNYSNLEKENKAFFDNYYIKYYNIRNKNI